MDQQFNISAVRTSHYPNNLPLDKSVHLNIDLKQRGVGGDDSRGALPHAEYRLTDKNYPFSYIISLL